MHSTQNEKIAQLLTLLEEPTAAYSAAHRTDSHRVAVASHSKDEADAASRGGKTVEMKRTQRTSK